MTPRKLIPMLPTGEQELSFPAPILSTGTPDECFTARPRSGVFTTWERSEIFSAKVRGQTFKPEDR